jgi:hypothetical protein
MSGKKKKLKKKEEEEQIMFRIVSDLLSPKKSTTVKSFENPEHNVQFSKDKLLSDIQRIHPSVIFIVYRSKNENIVVYELIQKPDQSFTIEPYWLELSEPYRKRSRDAGKLHDRVELSLLETQVAYGVTTTKIDDTTLLMRWNGDRLLKQLIPFVITIDPQQKTGRAIIDGHKYVRSVFVDSLENLSLTNLVDNIVTIKANYIDLHTMTPHTVDALSYLKAKNT